MTFLAKSHSLVDVDNQRTAAARTCTVTIESKAARALTRMQQLRNLGVESVVVSLKDWEVVDGRSFRIEEVCRVFGIPPDLLTGPVDGS